MMDQKQRYEEAAALYATEARLRASNAPDKVLEYIQQAAMWLEDGPCEDCGSYHEMLERGML